MPNSKSDPHQFSGFPTPKQNWFKMPNEWIDLCADINSLAEIKVVQYVMRHTWGHQEYGIKKRISVDEFMNGRQRSGDGRMDKGTGLSKPSVIAGIKSAVKRGFLIEEVDASDKARVKKYYSLRMRPEGRNSYPEDEENEDSNPQFSEEKGGVKDLNAGVKNLYPDVKKVYPRGKETLHRTKKETLETNLEKEKTNNNTANGIHHPIENDVVVALSSHGVGERVALRLVETFPEKHILEKIDFIDFILAERPDDIKKPAAWLRKAIEDDYAAPDGFISLAEQERLDKEAEDRAREQARQDDEFRALMRQRKLEEQQEKEAFLAQLHTQYGTTKQDEEIWQEILYRLEVSLSAANFALFQSGAVLKIEDDKILVGVKSAFQARQLSHPGLVIQFKRELESETGRVLEPEIIVIEDMP